MTRRELMALLFCAGMSGPATAMQFDVVMGMRQQEARVFAAQMRAVERYRAQGEERAHEQRRQ